MSSFIQMTNDLSLLGMASLLQTDFGALINKCQREEVESWDWSFLYTNVIINTVIQYTTGTVTVTQGSATVTSSGATFTPAMNKWWIRVGATLTTPVIVSYLSPTTLTLSTPWGGATTTNTVYSLFPLYYDVFPLIEVQRVRQIDFLTETSQEALNRIDPSRLSTGGSPSLRWSPAPWNNPTSIGHFQVELWPVPSANLPYIVDGKMGSIDMVNPTDLPLIPSAVLEAKAMMYACRALFASSGSPKWGSMADKYKDDYVYERDAARVADNRRKVTLGMSATGSRGGVNLGIDYVAVHDASGPPYVG